MLDAILWDNDGVLMDTEVLFFKETRATFADLGLNLTEEIWVAQYLGEGRSSSDIAEYLGADPDRIRPMLDKRNERYLHLLQQPLPLLPMVRETIVALSNKVKMAIVTGCDRNQLHVTHNASGLLEFFDVIVTSDDCAYTKPHPEPYLTAMKLLDTTAGNCIAVEDSERGLKSATAAGIACVIVPNELTRIQAFTDALSVERDVSGVLKHIQRS
jgi:HAD superfamily hydrolase (TIGR01509 family)